jgi:hypothetical protein
MIMTGNNGIEVPEVNTYKIDYSTGGSRRTD